MAIPLRKFVRRAPRYQVRPEDNQSLRISPANEAGSGAIRSSRLLNPSESGLAILVGQDLVPRIGDRIKVELAVPAGEQIAWFAEVVRTEQFVPEWWSQEAQSQEVRYVVALRWDSLPTGHLQSIRRGLEQRFLEELREQRRLYWTYMRGYWTANTGKVLMYLACAAASFYLLYWLSRPDANYDAQRGSPWGQRFKVFQIESE